MEQFLIRPFSSYSIHSFKAKKDEYSTFRTKPSINASYSNKSLGKLCRGLTLTKVCEDQKNQRIQSAVFPHAFRQTSQQEQEHIRPYTTISTKLRIKEKENKKDQFDNKFLDFELENKQSQKFNNIYYMKVPYKEALNSVNIPKNSISIKSSTVQYSKLYNIIKEIFCEIDISPHSLFVIKSKKLENYQIYILENGLLPISKCCDALIMVEIDFLKKGNIRCAGNFCKVLWKFDFIIPAKPCDSTFEEFMFADSKDKLIRKNISRIVTSGKYRLQNLVDDANNCVNIESKKRHIYAKDRPWTTQVGPSQQQNNSNSERKIKFRKLDLKPHIITLTTARKHFKDILQNHQEKQNDRTIEEINDLIGFI